jgi:DNA repair protein RecO (recombination protein O)
MSVTFRDQAIVLKISPQRDADRRYLVYTRRFGKLDLLAKGTRRGRSKMSPHMGWFGVVEIMVARGKFSDRLAGASLVRHYRQVVESLAATAATQSLLLTVDSLTRRDQPDEAIFDLVEQYLAAMADTDVLRDLSRRQEADRVELLTDAARLKLLDLVGFGPELDCCVSCRSELGDQPAMNFFRGGLECRRCRQADSLPLLPATRERLRELRRQPFGELAIVSAPHLPVARLIESLLLGHLGDRQPSAAFLRKVRV